MRQAEGVYFDWAADARGPFTLRPEATNSRLCCMSISAATPRYWVGQKGRLSGRGESCPTDPKPTGGRRTHAELLFDTPTHLRSMK